ncbi:MAG: protein kinase [Thermoanaerobaculia bacterium]
MTDETRGETKDAASTPVPADPAAPSGSGKQIFRQPGLAPDTVLTDRFRIVRFIARGGMGEVYEAEDRVLKERVALKTIRPDVAGDERTMERFLREVHLARSVTHPNVSRTFDVFHHEGFAFLTMELLAGETLSERLSRGGRMKPEEALPLVEQMAAALYAAHEAGIIHRDFKSANVMLVPDERRGGGVRVVVTDFGLARRNRPGRGSAAPLTETEAVLGTPDYMAPEQIEGRELTPATDVYALGIVMYEMVTGKPPFQGDTPLSVALKKLKEAAPSPRGQAPDLPPLWEKAILRCLERNPADRFPSAGDLVRALQGEEIPPGPGQRARRRRRIAVVAAALLLAAVAGFLVPRIGRQSPAGSPSAAAKAPRRAIAVLGFKNLAGRPEEAWVSTALAEMLTTELAAGEKLRAIPSEEVARMKIDLSLPEADTLGRDSLERVRNNIGADLVLLGSYLAMSPEAGGPIRLDLRLQDTGAGETVALVSEKGTRAEFDALVTRAGAQLRQKLELPAVSAAEAAAVRATLPSHPEAARLYAEGLAKLRLFDDMAARDLLEKAVAADPQHALAHSALAAAWSALGYDGRAREQGKTAFDLSGSLARETRLLVEGRFRAMNNEWERTIEIYRSLFTFFPDNTDYGLHLASAQTRAGRGNDALATIAALKKAFPREDARIALAEAETARALSDFPRVEKAAVRAVAIGGAQGARLLVAGALLLQASALRNTGDPKQAMVPAEEARRLYEAAGDRGGVAAAFNSLGSSRYDQGDLSGARKAYEGVLSTARAIGNKRAEAGALDNIASVVGDQGDLATAQRLSEQALAIFREIDDKAGEAETLNNLGAGLVVQGNFRGARAMFEAALPLYQETGDEGGLAIALTNTAEMQANEGDLAGAAASNQRSLEIFRDSGQKSKAVYPLVGLAGARFASGDLGQARKMLEEGLQICREADDRHEEAYVLSGLARIALAEDRPAEARKRHEEALAIRSEIGEAGAAAQSRVEIARVALEEGKLDEAAAGANAALVPIRAQKLPDDEVFGLAVLARALAGSGRLEEAGKVVDTARDLAAKSQHEGSRREFQLASAAVRAARGDAAGARKTLDAAVARAKQQGDLAFELEARLLLGKIEVASGAAAAGRARLDGVAKDAAAKGFLLVARKARA